MQSSGPLSASFETEFLSRYLTWPFQKFSQICPDLHLAVLKNPSGSASASPTIARGPDETSPINRTRKSHGIHVERGHDDGTVRVTLVHLSFLF